MKRLLLCALILTSCTSGKTTKVAAHEARFHYGDSIKIVNGQYQGCLGTISAVEPQDDDATFKYNIADLVCTDKSRQEHNVADIPESSLSL
jgi:transcription antitermination factor NusG